VKILDFAASPAEWKSHRSIRRGRAWGGPGRVCVRTLDSVSRQRLTCLWTMATAPAPSPTASPGRHS